MKARFLIILGLFSFIIWSTGCGQDDDNMNVPMEEEEIIPNPIASINLARDTFELGEEIQFENLSENADTYIWDFGDGNTSAEFEPKHIYETEGAYTVQLTAKGEGGEDETTLELVIKAPAFPPEGFYSGDTAEGGTISFNIEGDKIENFIGTYFISSNGDVFELSVWMPSFGTMTATEDGFFAPNFNGNELTGSFENDIITGTWKHDLGTTAFTAEKN